MAPIDDGVLLAAARNGDRRALDDLLRLHHPRIHAVCRRLLGNDADAADAAQEALISIVRGLPRFDGNSAFSTWAYRIATNAALDELRRRGRRPLAQVRDDRDQPYEPVDHRAHESLDSVADKMLLDSALADLRDDFRVAVVLRDVADLDYAEISEVLGIPPGTVRSRIARGRAALADTLGNQDGPTERLTDDPPA
jgi:RNA polymerase sigma-70 factor (ECF subfamily)